MTTFTKDLLDAMEQLPANASVDTLKQAGLTEVAMVSAAVSLKRIADVLDLVVDHNSFPSTSIAVSNHTTR